VDPKSLRFFRIFSFYFGEKFEAISGKKLREGGK
jgi:hypothetical protein